MKMSSNLRLWNSTKPVEIRPEVDESIIKISNIGNHLYFQTANNRLYYGIVQESDSGSYVELSLCEDWRIIDIACSKDVLYLVDVDGQVFRCTQNLEKCSEICLLEDYYCARGHTGTNCKMKVRKLAVGQYGELFITNHGQLWAIGSMPQIGVTSAVPTKVAFFNGRTVHDVSVGHDFAVAIVSKPKLNDIDSDEEDVFVANCPQCLAIAQLQTSISQNSLLCPLGVKVEGSSDTLTSGSQLTSPVSQNSISELCVKVQGSYDIETTSTSSKNDSSVSSTEQGEETEHEDSKIAKNIIFRNTEAAKEFLTRQISRMSSAGEEYLVECTEKPTRIIKENMTNVASFVYEGVKTVGGKVATLSRHVSGSSDCTSVVENIPEIILPRAASKDDWSQCTSERDLTEGGVKDKSALLVKLGSELVNCEIWTWGNIIHGQLGIGDNIKRERPMIITKLSNIGVRKISVQNCHTAVLTLDGRAFIWGRNDHHQVTVDTNMDQSSPKLYNTNKEERVKDIICGEYYTCLLNSNNNLIYFGKEAPSYFALHDNSTDQNALAISPFRNLVSTQQYTLLNVSGYRDNFFQNLFIEEQKFLEELLTVQSLIIKPLLKKSTSVLYEDLCKSYTELLYFWAVNLQSLLEYGNELISECDIFMFKNIEEFIFIYQNYSGTIFNMISIDAFQSITRLIEINQNLYKLRPELASKKDKNNEELLISMLLLAPVEKLNHYNSVIHHYLEKKDNFGKWVEFIEEQQRKKTQAELTRDFWFNSGKSIEGLKAPERRLLRESHKFPLFLQNAGRFSSHWFILFSDLFVHMNGSTSHLHNLATIWIEPQQDEATQQHQICLKMPEDTLVLYTSEAEAKINWFHELQSAIKLVINRGDVYQLPMVRNGHHNFTKNGFFKDAVYTGRWVSSKMHGSGRAQWPDGKVYTGQFSNNQLSGYGVMEVPNIGLYEGHWKENQQNGFGTFTYSNTDMYRGHFKDGQPHGHGFLRKGNFMANTASFYIGDWISGMKTGYGVMDDIVNGEKYIGSWQDNKKHGSGLIITSEGIYYEGIFNQDSLIGHGIMILDDGTYYEGEFRGTGNLYGKGTLSLPSGYTIEGTLTGSWNEGIKISNGTFTPRNNEKQLPKAFNEFCTPAHQKWKSLFKQCHQVLGIPEVNKKNEGRGFDTHKIWENVAVYLANTSQTMKKKAEKKRHDSLNNLDIIPPFGSQTLDLVSYQEVKNYLSKAFESNLHPLGSLLTDLSEAYTTTYGGRAHPLLLTHAIAELHHICKSLYEIVRYLFPALPVYDNDCLVENETTDEVVNYQSLLYPLILPKVHHPLFTLFTLKNEQQERQYKRTLMEWNKQADYTLMAFLSVDQKFCKMDEQEFLLPPTSRAFEDAIETLQQLKSTFSPTEKLIVIRETVEKMTPVTQALLGANYIWNMDDLFPIFLFVVVRARIPDLGSELDFIDNFLDPSLESGELGILYTTLKASYQQILQEKVSNY